MTTKQSKLAYDLPLWHSRPSPLRDRTLSQLSINPYGTFHDNSALLIHDYKQHRAGPDLSLTAVTVAAMDTKTGLFQFSRAADDHMTASVQGGCLRQGTRLGEISERRANEAHLGLGSVHWRVLQKILHGLLPVSSVY